VEIVSIQESQAVIEDSARHTAVLSQAIASFLFNQFTKHTRRFFFYERVILVPVSPFSDKCMALNVKIPFSPIPHIPHFGYHIPLYRV
jgi:hypothetical protein